MKAPDKIYVLLDERIGFLSHTFTNVPCGYESNQDIEYIRKDALMEWAKEKLQERHAPQFRDAIGQLIDKLNSM